MKNFSMIFMLWYCCYCLLAGTNLFNVAAHEVGHSLGLSHSNVESALMYPWYREMENGFDYELPEDDKQAIQYLYGARDTRRNWGVIPEYRPVHTTTTTTTTTTPRPTTRAYHTRPPQRPYDPRYPDGRRPYTPYSPPKPHYPHKPMHPDKKPHYPRHRGEQYPYGPERKTPHHKNPSEQTPERRYPTRTYPTINPDKYPTYNPERNHPKHGPPKESPTIKPPPDTCNTSYDAVAVLRRQVFIFKDAYFWRIGEDGLLPGYPAEINRLWGGLPHNLTHVDAVYERTDGRIIFFIGNKYYVFSRNNRLESGYPKPLTQLGLPNSLEKIDGAMVWGHNGQTYFYSGNKYWKFDESLGKVELDYPRDMSMWKGVGTDIDAVFQWKDGKTYFFKGKGFWKFNDQRMRVDHIEQKLSAPFWMGCTTNYERNEVGEKMPYMHKPSRSASSGTPTSSLALLLALLVYVLESNCAA